MKSNRSEPSWGHILGLALVIFVIGGLLGFGLALWQGGYILPVASPEASETDLRAEYYRGVYDSCVDFVQSVFSAPEADARLFCAENLIPQVAEDGWYENGDGESEGYAPPD